MICHNQRCAICGGFSSVLQLFFPWYPGGSFKSAVCVSGGVSFLGESLFKIGEKLHGTSYKEY